MSIRKGLLLALLLAAASASAGEGDVPYREIISADADCRAFFWDGVDALGDGKLAQAQEDLESAVKEDAGCFLAYLLLSQVAYAGGRYEESTAYLESIPPEPPELAAMYEDLAAALRADDFGVVSEKAGNIVTAYPQTITAIAALHLLARAQYFLGHRDEAALIIKAAYMYSALAPGTVPAYASPVEAEEFGKFAGVE
ncbi:MAG TPA: tetratricopeptide repeat protein [bacterium]|nr:tetratricopeptide repeat protein [bacterium]